MANPSSVKSSRVDPGGTPPPLGHLASHAAGPSGGQLVALVLSWVGVSLPLAWGVLETLRKTMALFQ